MTSLAHTAEQFCTALATKQNLQFILSFFASPTDPSLSVCFEHGLPTLAPFLGRPLSPTAYFTLINDLLTYEDMRFDKEDYIVDSDEHTTNTNMNTNTNTNEGVGKGKGRVSVRGRARFVWKETGEGWEEEFVYWLRFNEEMKLVRYEVWADSGAAYLASRGELTSGKERT